MTTTTKTEKTLEQIVAALSSTSAKIRYLSSVGYTTAQIEKLLKQMSVYTKNGDYIRYQHVRNVLMTRLTTK